MNKKYLVTGGAGFIGSAVAKRLIEEGNHVTIIDNLSTGYLQNIPQKALFINGNCEDEDLISTLKNEVFEAIFHIAGQSSGEISFDNPVLDMKSNVQSTIVLLKLAVEIGCKTFIYASSMSVYGNPNTLPVCETDELKPVSFYAAGKLASEHYLRIYSSTNIKTVALRLFNVYGEGQNMSNLRQGMASIFLAQAINTGKIIVKGSKDRFRDFIHIDDVVNAFLKSETDTVPSGVYNVCRGEKITVSEILNIINQSIPFPAEIEYAQSTPGDQIGIYGDPSNFENIFKLKSQIAFQEGMKNMIQWALKLQK